MNGPPNQSHLASTQCKMLDFKSKPLTFAVSLAFRGAVWGPVRILHPLRQGEGAFLSLHRLTSASGYKHDTCFMTQQCQIWGRNTGNVSGGTHTGTF